MPIYYREIGNTKRPSDFDSERKSLSDFFDQFAQKIGHALLSLIYGSDKPNQ